MLPKDYFHCRVTFTDITPENATPFHIPPKNIRTNIKTNIRQFALRLQGPKLFNSLPKLLEVLY